MGNVAGDFNSLRMLGNVSLRVSGNRIMDVIKPDNTNGAALLRVVNALSGPSDNDVRMSNISIHDLDAGGLDSFHGRRLNFIFRFRRLLPRFATLRGVVVPTFVTKGNEGRTGRHTRRLLRFVNLDSETDRGPTRLSNNRGRHMTITETLIGGPTIVLTSRPSKDLSAGGGTRLRRLFFSLESGFNRAFIVIARSRNLTSVASHAVRLGSKVVRGAIRTKTTSDGRRATSGGGRISTRRPSSSVSYVWAP